MISLVLLSKVGKCSHFRNGMHFGYDWELRNPLDEIEQEIRNQTSEIQSTLCQQEWERQQAGLAAQRGRKGSATR